MKMEMPKNKITQNINRCKIIAILRGLSKEELLKTVARLYPGQVASGGLHTV